MISPPAFLSALLMRHEQSRARASERRVVVEVRRRQVSPRKSAWVARFNSWARTFTVRSGRISALLGSQLFTRNKPDRCAPCFWCHFLPASQAIRFHFQQVFLKKLRFSGRSGVLIWGVTELFLIPCYFFSNFFLLHIFFCSPVSCSLLDIK